MNLRIKRLESDVMREISVLLQTEVKDPIIKNIVITGCSITNDLSFAKIYFTTTDDREKVEKDLNNAAGFFRSLLAERLQIRHTPELRFIFDESIEYGKKIEKIIEKLHEEENNK